MMRFNWRSALALVHRWLGVAGGLLLLAWFISGVAMMYVRMPAFETDERLRRSPPLDLAQARLSPVDALRLSGARSAGGVDVGMLGGRPVYRFTERTTTTVFADTGDTFHGLTPDQATDLARAWMPEHATTLRYDMLVTEPDQWTLQSREHLPLHRIRCGDAADTRLYLSNITGEPVMKTTRRDRFWAYWGPVTHWLYLPVLRRNGPAWTRVIIWSSVLGCVLSLSGLALGLVRYSPLARIQAQGRPSRSPYVGLLKWHHYAGLTFGAITFTWTFSGLLSMGPFGWLSSGGLSPEERQALNGGPLRLDSITLTALREAVSAMRPSLVPKELALVAFGGDMFWMADPSSRPDDRRLVSAAQPDRGALARFAADEVVSVAREARPGVAVLDAAWIEAYDDYYYDRGGEKPLPVARIRYDDPDRTWLYLDVRGAVVLVSGQRDRLYRWLYHGLHSFDVPILYNRRPLWDLVIIMLSLGGVVIGATTLVPAWRRLRRHVARLRGRDGVGRILAAALVVPVLYASPARAQDWPAFRGPGGQGHSVEHGLPLDWSEAKNILWKTPVPGLGWSSPVVAGGRLWITAATGDRDISLRVLAFDVDTGKEIVNVEVRKIRSPYDINPKNSWASPTPIVDGDRVYVHFGAEGTAALTTSGEIVWKRQFPYRSQHGAGGSPVLYGDLLIFSCDGSDAAFLIAVDKRTGKVRWRTNRRLPSDQAYTTPLIIRVGERDQVVSVGAYRATAYDPRTGNEIWRVSYADGFSNVPRPVFGNGLVYIATGFQQPALIAVRPDGTGDVTRSHIAWKLQRGAPLTPSPLLVGNEFFVVNDGGIMSCLDAATGVIHWQQRLGGTYSASPVYADGRIYLQSEQGVTSVIAPGKEFRLLVRNTLDGGMQASMAVSGGSFFVRTDTHLYRIAAPRK